MFYGLNKNLIWFFRNFTELLWSTGSNSASLGAQLYLYLTISSEYEIKRNWSWKQELQGRLLWKKLQYIKGRKDSKKAWRTRYKKKMRYSSDLQERQNRNIGEGKNQSKRNTILCLLRKVKKAVICHEAMKHNARKSWKYRLLQEACYYRFRSDLRSNRKILQTINIYSETDVRWHLTLFRAQK